MSDRRIEKRILIFVMVFYAVISILAVCFFNLSSSIFARRGEVKLSEYIMEMLGIGTAPDVSGVTVSEDKLEGLEALGGDDKAGEEATEEAETAEAVPEDKEPQEPEPEEEEPSEEPEPEEEHFYSFRTNNRDTILRMREAPGEDAEIIYELRPGSSGYVIELGDEWSRVSAYGHEGYCVNEYLTMTEITEEEYTELKERTYNTSSSGRQDTGDAQTAGMDAALTVPAATTDASTGFIGTDGQILPEDP